MSIFTKVAVNRPPRSTFPLNHENKFTCQIGQLVPIMCEPVLPGDHWKFNTEFMLRMMPMMAPIMQRLDVSVHVFFVPNRLIMDNFEQFMTGGEDGKEMIQVPMISNLTLAQDSDNDGSDATVMWNEKDSIISDSGITQPGELMDFLGYQPIYVNPSTITDANVPLGQSLLPINAYNLIWWEYYRDQNVDPNQPYECPLLKTNKYARNYNELFGMFNESSMGGGRQYITEYFKLRHRCWAKDYFTSALPWTQRGEDVHIPIYGNATMEPATLQVSRINGTGTPNTPLQDEVYNSQTGELMSGSGNDIAWTNGGLRTQETPIFINARNLGISSEEVQKLRLNIEQLNAASIIEFRRANALQKFLERSATVGGRYKEFVLGHFGVHTADSRLDRPEYLGGGRVPIQISEVLQTSETTSESPLADMAGHGIGVGNTGYIDRKFTEHGYIMAIMSVIPRAAYYQGIRKDLLKYDRLDWYQPAFANIGEQPIQLSELFVPKNMGMNVVREQMDKSFGYTPRYAEYKQVPSQIHGWFRTSEMDYWHMARQFAAEPNLSKEFMQVDEYQDGLNRVFTVPGAEDDKLPHLAVVAYNKVTCSRLMPYFGTPTL